MSAVWRLVTATQNLVAGTWRLDFAVGVDQYASVTVTRAAYPDGAWRDVVQAEADEMIDPGSIIYAPRRRHR